MSTPSTRHERVFLLIWLGQLISIIGSGLTSFSLSFWVYQHSGSTTRFALIILSYSLPGIVIGPFAGALVDRWDRRLIMLLSSFGAAVCTLAMCVLFYMNRLHDWQIAVAVSGISICGAFQWPAYFAANTLLLRKEKFARGSALVQLAQAIQLIVSPALAILLLQVIPIQVLMGVDFLTYIFFIAVLCFVEIPSPVSAAAPSAPVPFLVELASGWEYIRTRPGLLPLLACFTALMFAARMVQVLILPLVLGIASPKGFAIVSTVASCGLAVGSIAIAVHGGVKRRINGFLASGLFVGVALTVAGLAPFPALVASALFTAGVAIPFGANCDDVIWQLKTQPDLQGRVFAIRRMANDSCLPLACIAAGLLVDKFFRPLLQPQGALAGTLGRLSGTGPARGSGLFLASTGLLLFMITILTSLLASVRKIEERLPDVTHEDVLVALSETMEVQPQYQD